MAGHSKWSKIKRQKAANDSKRSAAFTKFSKAITVAAKTGGSVDPAYNFKLKTAIDKAKAGGMTKVNIERALEKASGKGGEAELKEVVYEGYLPGGVAVMIFTATDNTNRTYADIRTIFNKSDGSLGTSGSVAYQFEKKGIMKITKPDDWSDDQEEKLLELAMDVGFNDIESDDEIWLYCDPAKISEYSSQLEKKIEEDMKNLEIISSADELMPASTVEVSSEEDVKNIIKAMTAFDDHDDIIETVANFDLDETLL